MNVVNSGPNAASQGTGPNSVGTSVAPPNQSPASGHDQNNQMAAAQQQQQQSQQQGQQQQQQQSISSAAVLPAGIAAPVPGELNFFQ